MQSSDIRAFLDKAARQYGFDAVGVAPAGPLRELEYFPEWIAEGRAGDMQYLASRNEAGELKRAALANVAPWARSVIVGAVNYNSAQPYSTEYTDSDHGWISRYAWNSSDYHDLVLRRMRQLESDLHEFVRKRVGEAPRTWCYVDTGPVVERVFAHHAGIGWAGKNTCIINQRLGSWLFLSVMLTSMDLEPDVAAEDRCGSCTRCLEACPTQALIAPHKLDASRCISYLTIEKHGSIPEDLRNGIGRNLFGCDICQDVCPWNRKAPASANPEFAPRTELVNPLLTWFSGMKVEEFRETFRGSPIKRAKLHGLHRNAVIAMGNSGDEKFVPELERLARDEDANVAEHARWALEKLRREHD